MRDVMHHVGEQLAERAVADRLVERGVAHAGADAELAVRDREPVERRDAVDVDEMRRLGEPERHGRHQALAAGQHAAVVRGNFGEQRRPPRRRFSARGSETPQASSGFNFGIGVCF